MRRHRMKTKQKPRKTLNEMEKTNLLQTEFKTLVFRIFKELIEYGNKIKRPRKK